MRIDDPMLPDEVVYIEVRGLIGTETLSGTKEDFILLEFMRDDVVYATAMGYLNLVEFMEDKIHNYIFDMALGRDLRYDAYSQFFQFENAIAKEKYETA